MDSNHRGHRVHKGSLRYASGGSETLYYISLIHIERYYNNSRPAAGGISKISSVFVSFVYSVSSVVKMSRPAAGGISKISSVFVSFVYSVSSVVKMSHPTAGGIYKNSCRVRCIDVAYPKSRV